MQGLTKQSGSTVPSTISASLKSFNDVYCINNLLVDPSNDQQGTMWQHAKSKQGTGSFLK